MMVITFGALGNATNWGGGGGGGGGGDGGDFSCNKNKMSRVGKTIRLAFA